ncbi:MAG TPA: ATP-binding cassette domain-containing protein, partial [Isoptericola sp.]|nr:ATP-binding cassette domain-containing protein [Isoptericola sp.]
MTATTTHPTTRPTTRPTARQGAHGGAAGRVEVHGLHKSFGTLEVLRDVNLTFEPGTVTVVLGPSGSGKSTLLR